MDSRGLGYQNETIVTVKASLWSVIVSSKSTRFAVSFMGSISCLTERCSTTADQAIIFDSDR